jgi:hypothetical protein
VIFYEPKKKNNIVKYIAFCGEKTGDLAACLKKFSKYKGFSST